MMNRLAKRSFHKWCAVVAMAIGVTSSGYAITKVVAARPLTNTAIVDVATGGSSYLAEVSSSSDKNQKAVSFSQPSIAPDTQSDSYPPPDLVYNVSTLPPLAQSPTLQKVVDGIVGTIKSTSLPSQSLSISLINLKGKECCEYASYSDRTPRFPASVAKLFWLVAFQAQFEKGILSKDVISGQELYKMIQKSDNEPTSRVVDHITVTESGNSLNSEFLGIWEAKRKWVNRFFEAANYQSLNLSQKNFPVPFLHLKEPEGRDLQIRGEQVKPIRNALTTYDTARLMYEIYTNQSISQEASRRMKSLLKRDLHPEAWKGEEYNSIEGFLGESLPLDTYFASKVGWTSGSRQEVSLIRSADGSAEYILVIFGDDRAYADDWKIFPKVSKMVFDRMLTHTNR